MRNASRITSLVLIGWTTSVWGAQSIAASANDVLPACKLYISIMNRQGAAKGSELAHLMDAGECLGAVYSLLSVSKGLRDDLKFCPPVEFDAQQGVRAVITYVEAKQARGRKDFTVIALEALRAAWPCR